SKEVRGKITFGKVHQADQVRIVVRTGTPTRHIVTNAERHRDGGGATHQKNRKEPEKAPRYELPVCLLRRQEQMSDHEAAENDEGEDLLSSFAVEYGCDLVLVLQPRQEDDVGTHHEPRQPPSQALQSKKSMDVRVLTD